MLSDEGPASLREGSSWEIRKDDSASGHDHPEMANSGDLHDGDDHGTTHSRLLRAVADIAPTIVADADEAERTRRLPQTCMDAFRSSGLLAALVPRELGGSQADPLTELALIEAVSTLDASIGWAYWAMAGSTARAASMLPAEALDEVFSDKSSPPVVVFQERSFGNVGHATPCGLHVAGTWPFGTGVVHADWVLAIVDVGRAGQGGQAEGRARLPAHLRTHSVLAAIVPRRRVEIIDTWRPSGLSATATFDYRVDTEVPWRRVWGYAPPRTFRGLPHFSFRRAPIKHTGWALGAAASALALLTDHIRARGRVDSTKVPSSWFADLGRIVLVLEAARASASAVVAQVWDEAQAHQAVSQESQEHLRALARYVTEVALDVVDLINRYSDASLAGFSHPLTRAVRDITTGAMHAEVSPHAMEAFGRRTTSDDVHRRRLLQPHAGGGAPLVGPPSITETPALTRAEVSR